MFVSKVFFFSLIQFLFLITFSQYRYDCTEDFCSKSITCPDIECTNGRLIKNATKCGCCHVCIQQLGEGDNCNTQELAVIPRQECGQGLKCEMEKQTQEAKCAPIVTTCTNENTKVGDIVECDEYGFFKPVVCKSDAICYCVNENGNRIFGTDLATKKSLMNCDCARDYDNFQVHRQIPDGNFLRCLPNGNYDSVQCSDEFCYCMNDIHTLGTVSKTIKELLCYDKQKHREDDEMLRSKCWHKRNGLLNIIENHTKQGITIIGLDVPQCDLDGSYAPVQCKERECYCVKKNGDLYPQKKYRVRREPGVAKKMTCSCIKARDHEMLMDLKNEDRMKDYLKRMPCNDEEEHEKNLNY